jgi:hypothetical protein
MVMRTEGRKSAVVPIIVSATVMLWPAYWNGYPLVFADTGTYLSQAIEHYVGWDRPIFYSLFLLPLHMRTSTWPCIAAQALLTAHILHLTRRALLPLSSSWWLLPVSILLSVTTTLPWYAAQLGPDIFTPLLVLAVALLVLAPDRLSRSETLWLVILAAFMIAVHQSHVLLAAGLLLLLLPFRRQLGLRGTLVALAPPVLAVTAMVAVNVAAFGRVSPSPFGNVFVLARIIYDGPGMDALRRECPQAGWQLCRFEQFPANSDDFLWREDGPVVRAGGAKRVAGEANAIILAAVRAEPERELNAALHNSLRQFTHFAIGDGLVPWPATVTPVIERNFPPVEASAYVAARQTRGELAISPHLQAIYTVIALLGLVGCCAIIPIALCRRHIAAGFAVATLLAIAGHAAITGALSGPHDRYQSRIMWLPPLVALIGAASLIADRRR